MEGRDILLNLDIPKYFWKTLTEFVHVRAIMDIWGNGVELHSFLTLVLRGALCNVTQHIFILIVLNDGTRW